MKILGIFLIVLIIPIGLIIYRQSKPSLLEETERRLQHTTERLMEKDKIVKDIYALAGEKYESDTENRDDYKQISNEVNQLSQSRNHKVLIFTIIAGFLFLGSCFFLSAKR